MYTTQDCQRDYLIGHEVPLGRFFYWEKGIFFAV
jgi:hypothetical protein